MAPSIPGGRRLFACIDIGGSKFVAGICDEGGDILCSTRHEWSGVSEGQILEQVASAMGEELAEHPGLRNRVVAGGVTIPGFADPKRGIWVDSDYLNVHDLPICDFLANRLRLPFFGDNDCNACALAEHYFGTAKGARDFLYITVSSGIGGGIFLGDRLFYGDRQLAGEIGLTVVEDRPRPEFSRFPRGRLEDYCSTRGMRTTYVSLGGTAQSSFGGREIAAAARAEDPAALETMRLEGVYLARAIARMDAVAAPSQVVVGGGDIAGVPRLWSLPLLRAQQDPTREQPSGEAVNSGIPGGTSWSLCLRSPWVEQSPRRGLPSRKWVRAENHELPWEDRLQAFVWRRGPSSRRGRRPWVISRRVGSFGRGD